MVREKDPIWKYWRATAPDEKSSGKRYSKCIYCDHKLQNNASRFKQHTVLLCTEAPSNIKQEFSKQVAEQSVATTVQKRRLCDGKESDTKTVPGVSSMQKVQNNAELEASYSDSDDPDEISAGPGIEKRMKLSVPSTSSSVCTPVVSELINAIKLICSTFYFVTVLTVDSL
jgi:hypothetical protein